MTARLRLPEGYRLRDFRVRLIETPSGATLDLYEQTETGEEYRSTVLSSPATEALLAPFLTPKEVTP